jgi:hypothetical protein
MISDVLFQAIRDIEEYQRRFSSYDFLEEELTALKGAMMRIQDFLDAPPKAGSESDYMPAGKWPTFEEAKEWYRKVKLREEEWRKREGHLPDGG